MNRTNPVKNRYAPRNKTYGFVLFLLGAGLLYLSIEMIFAEENPSTAKSNNLQSEASASVPNAGASSTHSPTSTSEKIWSPKYSGLIGFSGGSFLLLNDYKKSFNNGLTSAMTINFNKIRAGINHFYWRWDFMASNFTSKEIDSNTWLQLNTGMYPVLHADIASFLAIYLGYGGGLQWNIFRYDPGFNRSTNYAYEPYTKALAGLELKFGDFPVLFTFETTIHTLWSQGDRLNSFGIYGGIAFQSVERTKKPKKDLSQPIEIQDIQFYEIFSNLYKKYSQSAIGSIRILNQSDKPIKNIYLKIQGLESLVAQNTSTDQKNSLVYPSVQPGETLNFPCVVPLSDQTLAMKADQKFEAIVTVFYTLNDQVRQESKKTTILIYDRNAWVHDNLQKIGSFILTDDTYQQSFLNSIQSNPTNRQSTALPRLIQAASIYKALQKWGIQYKKDASTPFLNLEKNPNGIDRTQYSRETLLRKQGDIDELVVLLAALLQQSQIPTMILPIPKSLLLLIDTGITPLEREKKICEEEGLVLSDPASHPTVWIPLDVHGLDHLSFVESWKSGIFKLASVGKEKINAQWKNNALNVQAIQKAYPPISLEPVSEKWDPLSFSDLPQAMIPEIESLEDLLGSMTIESLLRKLEKDPDNIEWITWLGRLYMLAGQLKEADARLEQALDIDYNYYPALFHKARLLALRNKLDESELLFQQCLVFAPEDLNIYLALSIIYNKKSSLDEKKKEITTLVEESLKSSKDAQQRIFEDQLNKLFTDKEYDAIIYVLEFLSMQNQLSLNLKYIKGKTEFNSDLFRSTIQTFMNVDQKADIGDKIDYYLGVSYFKDQSPGDTIYTLHTFAEKYPDSPLTPQVYLYLGFAYREIGDTATAKEWLEKVLTISKDPEWIQYAKQALKTLE